MICCIHFWTTSITKRILIDQEMSYDFCNLREKRYLSHPVRILRMCRQGGNYCDHTCRQQLWQKSMAFLFYAFLGYHRLQKKFAKVMFSQVSVCPWGRVRAYAPWAGHTCPQSFMSPGHAHPPGHTCPLRACMPSPGTHATGHACPPRQILRDVLNERAVLIILECILVKLFHCFTLSWTSIYVVIYWY